MNNKSLKEKIWLFFHSPRQLFYFTVIWGLIFSVLSPLFNQFSPIYGGTNEFQRIMYLHVLTIVLVVALSYIIVDVYRPCLEMSEGVRTFEFDFIMYGGFIAIVINSIFGMIDSVENSIPMWMQIVAFLFLDEIAIALIIALPIHMYRTKGLENADLTFWLLWVSIGSAFTAAMIGHIGGFIMAFGGSFMTPYIHSIGLNSATFEANAITSHSHEMIVAIMAGIVALFATKYGYNELKGLKKFIAKLGLEVALFGVVAMTAVYVVGGLTNYVIPTMFTFGPGAANGLAQDDLLTGIVGIGAFLVLIGMLWSPVKSAAKNIEKGTDYLMNDPIGMAILLSWVFALVMIPVLGYSIELQENYFGMLGFITNAPGAISDINFMRFHQMFGFFLMPAMSTLLMGLDYFSYIPKNRELIGYSLIFGSLVMFIGGVGLIFFNTASWSVYWYITILGMILFAFGVGTAIYTGMSVFQEENIDKVKKEVKKDSRTYFNNGKRVPVIGGAVVVILLLISAGTIFYVHSQSVNYSYIEGINVAGTAANNITVNMTFPYAYKTGTSVDISMIATANFTMENVSTNITSFSVVSTDPSLACTLTCNESMTMVLSTPAGYFDGTLTIFVNSK